MVNRSFLLPFLAVFVFYAYWLLFCDDIFNNVRVYSTAMFLIRAFLFNK
jgi:hypothetical protein